mgnify:FL=1
MDKEDKECLNLDELKLKYVEFKERYGLPEFFELNKVFEIEEVDVETDFLLRSMRKVITEKIANYMRFFEVVLNPSNAPMFFFNFIKKLNNQDKEILGNVYEKLGYIEIELIKMDLDYKEETEAEFIRKIYILFDEIKPEILGILDKMSGNGNLKKEDKGSYFG